MEGKIIILSAPSGSGKSTIISSLREDENLNLDFSISATSRQPRSNETHGVDYYFLTEEEFEHKVKKGEFVEWEEVYAGCRYGTLESEIRRVIEAGRNLIMDVDVKGALSIKKKYGNKALLLFIMPPSLEELSHRLKGRGTDSDDTIRRRLEKAEYEIGFADQFDYKVINDQLSQAVKETSDLIKDFIGK